MSRSGGRYSEFNHANDFTREEVLKALRPSLADPNDEVAIGALRCFQAGSAGSTQLAPFTDTLVQIAGHGATIPRRVAAMAAFSGTQFPVVSNTLPQWLGDSSEEVRLQAVLLLPNFPGEFSEHALRERVADPSPKVRAGVADAIGNGKMASLLPILRTLFSAPVGQTNPVPDVHTAAGSALLKFDVTQVAEILKANLNDEEFRPSYLCKLAESDPGPWLTNLVEVLEARRIRVEKEVETSGVEPKASYLRARMALSGTYFNCWNIIHKYLHDLPAAAFADGKMDLCLGALEKAGTTGSREPTMLYELYRMKGLNQRAAQFRSENDNRSAGYDLSQYFDKVDAQYPNKGGSS
jgi:hypothetical protein